MFCNQCEQTARGVGCTVRGVCGKKPEAAALQDLLTCFLRGLSVVAHEARGKGIVDSSVNRFTCEAIFATLTNVNFAPESLAGLVKRTAAVTEGLKKKAQDAGVSLEMSGPAACFEPAGDLPGLVKQGEEAGYLGFSENDPNLRSLKQTLVIGIRGLAAYAHHAAILGHEDDNVYAFIHEGMASLGNPHLSVNDWLGLLLRCGATNLRAMELLDAAHTLAFGHPEPTAVPLGHKKGKCILVSGHDLKDLELLLEQCRGKGINVYTHGEMLPAQAYPGLKKYRHLAGHYGTAWQNQKKEFASFPGPILMTTNCIQEPQDSYFASIFTTGPVGWPGVTHLAGGDFSQLIDKALEMPGYPEDEDKGEVLCGFAHNAVMGVAGKVIEAVKSGAIKHFFLVAGCDGAKPGRNYYTEFVEKAPADTVVLTLACGKFRFFDKKLGDIGGIPRLLDIGQCNDAYSAVKIAVALAEAFNCDVNELPLSMVLSWYEQKAVAILLTLFHLGIKNIRLGPSLPAFVSPDVLEVLVEKFAVKPVKTPEEDLAAILA